MFIHPAFVTQLKGDIVAFDAAGDPVLLVEARTNPRTYDKAKDRLQTYLSKASNNIPYATTATPQQIGLYRWDGQHLSPPIYKAAMASVLSFYDPEFANKPIAEFYLVTLIEAWLRDIAYHWKSECPPEYTRLAETGLVARLANGTTVAEAALN